MRSRTSTMLCGALSLMLISALGMGCGDDDEGSPVSDGGAGSGAAGSSAGTGGGAGTVATDGGDLDSGVADAGDSGPGACAEPLNPLPAVLLPRCTAATAQCVVDCSAVAAEDRSACQNACLNADTQPSVAGLGCTDCRFIQLLACADANGCHDEVAAMRCCIDEKCPTGNSAPGCADTMCAAEVEAALTCAINETPDCVDPTKPAIVTCYDLDDADAGI
jgi:hypothetical protein